MNLRNFSSLSILLSLILVLVGCGNEETSSDTSSNEEGVDFPTRNIQMIVHTEPGGPTDIMARTLTGVVSDYLPNEMSVSVENRPGGSGTVGLTELAQAEPDGYTIGMASSGPVTIQPHNEEAVYGIEDLAPIMQVNESPNVLVVRSDAPWENFDEWMAHVEQNPGEFNYGTSGAGLTQHLTMEQLAIETDTDMTHVAFNGDGPAITALLGGDIDGVFLQTLQALSYIEEGDFRPIFISGSERPGEEVYQDTPLLEEENIDIGIAVRTGIYAPADTPDEIVQILHDAFQEALEDPEVTEQFESMGSPAVYESPSDFQELIEDMHDSNGEVMEEVGL